MKQYTSVVAAGVCVALGVLACGGSGEPSEKEVTGGSEALSIGNFCQGKNLKTDPNNCGTCQHVCPSGYSCTNGQCTDVVYRPNSCVTDEGCPTGPLGLQEKCVYDQCDSKVIAACTMDYATCAHNSAGKASCPCSTAHPGVWCKIDNYRQDQYICCPQGWGYDDANSQCVQ